MIQTISQWQSTRNALIHREVLLRQLRALYSEKKNVLIMGPAGIGKTTLLLGLSRTLPLQICDDCSSLGRICDILERQFGWNDSKLNLTERKNRLLRYLEQRNHPIAFDHVATVRPRAARFIARLIPPAPVWIACRSGQRKEIGHLWEHLYSFTRITVPPFSMAETSAMIEHAMTAGMIQSEVIRYTAHLHRISKGVPRILYQLLNMLKNHRYNIAVSSGLKLLELDRKISQLIDSASEPI
jgi:hypothetical protein